MAKRFNQYQIDALMAAFEHSEHLTRQNKVELGTATGLDVEQIASWFNRESVGDFEGTNAGLRQSQEREAELQKELQESTRREAELGAENQHLRQQPGMDGGDSQGDMVLKFWNRW